MAYLLALCSAVLYGTADFLGGLASRRTHALAVVVRSQCIALVLLVLMLPVLPEATATRSDLVWGGVAGLAVSAALPLLYQALAVGRMAVVAPTTAVCAVMIPVVTDLWRGEQLTRVTILGFGLAIVAIVLVGQQEAEAASGQAPTRAIPPGVGLALASGVAIGLFFLALAETDARAGMWPLLAVRAVAVPVLGIAALVSGRPLRMAAPVGRMAMATGAFDVAAGALYLLASRYGPLSIAVTLSSLYPASTVILARGVLGERLNGLQVAGVACALLAITLIVGGSSLPQ